MQEAYAIKRQVEGPQDETVARVTKLLGKEGFGVLTEIDMQATMKEKLDEQMPPYVILGACAPPMAWEAVNAEPDIGVFLPCNVTVRQDDEGRTWVAAMDPRAVLTMVGDETVAKVAEEVKERLTRVVEAI